MRGERRRHARERQAVEMSALNNHPDSALAEIAPILDEAINELGADDRDAILLRFFEHRTLRSVGEALGTSENVAQKRVARAVQELAALLRRRGFTLPAAALATGLAAEAVTAAPAGLALSIAATVVSKAGAAGGTGLTSAKVAVMAKLKLGIVCAIVVAGAVTAIFLQYPSKTNLPEQSVPVQQGADQPESASLPDSAPAGPASADPPSAERPHEPRRVNTAAALTPTPPPATISRPVRTNAPAPETAVPGTPALPIQRFTARSGSKVRIEGTANIIHPTWQAESSIIGGYLEVGLGFPLEEGQTVQPAPVQAQAEAFITVRSLKSVEKDGRPYSDRMDEVMYEHLKEAQFKRINYKLTELTLKETPTTRDAPYAFDSTGELTVAGVTRTIEMPVNILPVADREGKLLEITGSITVKMTDFKVDPVDINLVVGHIKTGDDVNLLFKWIVAPKGVSADLPPSGMVPLVLDLPVPAFKGTPKDVPFGPNVEPLSDKPRAPMMVPPGLDNIAPGSTLTSSDKNATADTLAKITDGDKSASDQSVIFLRKGTQWVQMDWGSPQEIFALVIWHAHNSAKVYHDVIVQVADNAGFTQHVRTIFNNDADNSSRLGAGANREYWETYEGKLVNANGVKACCLRFCSNGSTESALNEYTEIEVYGRPARQLFDTADSIGK